MNLLNLLKRNFPNAKISELSINIKWEETGAFQGIPWTKKYTFTISRVNGSVVMDVDSGRGFSSKRIFSKSEPHFKDGKLNEPAILEAILNKGACWSKKRTTQI